MALFRYPHSKMWWYDFRFNGRRIRGTTKSSLRSVAVEAERVRRREEENRFNGISGPFRPKPFREAVAEYLQAKKLTMAASPLRSATFHLDQRFLPLFGSRMVTEITAEDIKTYQDRRLQQGASNKYINLELGTLRGVLKRAKAWANIQQDVRMLPIRDDTGCALSSDERHRLLRACQESQGRWLLPAVTLALNTCMRTCEIRLLKWRQIDFDQRVLIVGKSKTRYGSGRRIPLNDDAMESLVRWAGQFPQRELDHLVFPSERYPGTKRAIL
jgi:integrase